MAKTIDDHKRILSFEQNEVFDAVLAFLDASVEAEVDRAVGHERGRGSFFVRPHSSGSGDFLAEVRWIRLHECDRAGWDDFHPGA